MQVDGDILKEMIREAKAYDSEGNTVPLDSSLSETEAIKIQELVYEIRPASCLEIGLAMGVSTLSILYALRKLRSGRHTAIDPNQTGKGYQRWNGIGLSMVQRAGLKNLLEFLEEPSYLALPRMLAEKTRFDLILIDGWHSFDYTFVDYFFSDLLLNERGILIFHDVKMPQVNHVCWFVETHKHYERLGPKIPHPLNPLYKIKKRISRFKGNSEDDPSWGSMQAYRKLRSTIVPWSFYYSNFYPYFRLYKWLRRIRGFKVESSAF